jgi:hypothetical protein
MQAVGKTSVVILLFTLLVFRLGIKSYSQDLSTEYQIKGAYIFNFAQFTNWPATSFQNSNDPFIIGIIGKDPFGVFIDELVKGELKSGHPIVIRRFNSFNDVNFAHVLFIGKDANVDIAQINKLAGNKPILTMSDLDGHARQGGIVEFYVEENKVRFVVNVEEGERKNLQFSSKLLRLAKICCK